MPPAQTNSFVSHGLRRVQRGCSAWTLTHPRTYPSGESNISIGSSGEGSGRESSKRVQGGEPHLCCLKTGDLHVCSPATPLFSGSNPAWASITIPREDCHDEFQSYGTHRATSTRVSNVVYGEFGLACFAHVRPFARIERSVQLQAPSSVKRRQPCSVLARTWAGSRHCRRTRRCSPSLRS
jgi:hypothetical protein